MEKVTISTTGVELRLDTNGFALTEENISTMLKDRFGDDINILDLEVWSITKTIDPKAEQTIVLNLENLMPDHVCPDEGWVSDGDGWYFSAKDDDDDYDRCDGDAYFRTYKIITKDGSLYISEPIRHVMGNAQFDESGDELTYNETIEDVQKYIEP